jgi:succinate dehydrogenase/fumarate reductase cytochrome b subunit
MCALSLHAFLEVCVFICALTHVCINIRVLLWEIVSGNVPHADLMNDWQVDISAHTSSHKLISTHI